MPTIQREQIKIEIDPASTLAVAWDGRNAVIDGDTIVVGGEHWRLHGYDAPEISKNCCDEEAEKGRRAKAYFEQLLQWAVANECLEIYLRRSRDRHGRRLVDVRVGGEHIGEAMKRAGLAADYAGRGPKPLFCSCPERRAYREAEAAMRERRAFLLRRERGQ